MLSVRPGQDPLDPKSRYMTPRFRGWQLPLICVAVCVCIALRAGPAPAAPGHTLADLLWSDMHLPHEVMPEGVPPGFDWAKRPRIHLDRNRRRFHALEAWGQIYACARRSLAPFASVELRDLNAWVFDHATLSWIRVQKSRRVAGAAYREDYVNNEATPGQTGVGPGGGTTVTLTPGRNFHFWDMRGRARVDATHMLDIVVTVRARLLAPYSGYLGEQECVILAAGADYWISKTALWTVSKNTVSNVGIGRFKRIGPSWRLYTMSTASGSLLRHHPLPITIPSSEFY
jgi:hypothetical protein